MTKQVERIMVWPQIVPIRMARKLQEAGIGETSCVHEHIRNGTLQSLQGIGRAWEARIVRQYSSSPRQLAKDVLAGKTEFVDTQVGLSATGFLLLAEGHLVKAQEALGHKSLVCYMVGEAIVRAKVSTQEAMKLLKEEPCKEDLSPDDAPLDAHWYHEDPNY